MAQGNHKHVTVQTTDDFIKQCRDVFSVFDPDGAGTITQYKLSEVMKAYGWPAEHGELQVGVHILQMYYMVLSSKNSKYSKTNKY